MPFGILSFPIWCRWVWSGRLLLVGDDLLQHHLIEFVEVFHDVLRGFLESHATAHSHGQLPSGPLPVKGELLPFLWFASCFGYHPVTVCVDVLFLSPPDENHCPPDAVDPVENCQETLGVPNRIVCSHYLIVVVEGEGLCFPWSLQQRIDFSCGVE